MILFLAALIWGVFPEPGVSVSGHWGSQDKARNSSEPVRSKNGIDFTPGMSGKSREKPLFPVVLFELTHTFFWGS